jgi:hypothetical protein
LWAVLSAVLFGEEQAFGLREKIGFAGEWAVATDFERDGAGMAKVL